MDNGLPEPISSDVNRSPAAEAGLKQLIGKGANGGSTNSGCWDHWWGPAGSSIAAYLAKAGLKCAVFERETFPREHEGESLVPSTNRILREIGFIDQMDEVGFARKFGAVWTTEKKPVYHVKFDGMEPDCHANI